MRNMVETVDPPRVWRYSFPNIRHEGWAVFLLDSYGMMAVASDFGNYVHHWPRQGWGEGDFREFLATMDTSYLLGKITGGRRVLDEQKTFDGIKEHILRYRREGYFTRERAREEFDLLNGSDFHNEIGFHDWYQNTSISDAYEEAVYDFHPQAVAFTKKVWPRLVKQLKEDLGLP